MQEVQKNYNSTEGGLHPEDILGPPQIDIFGFGLIIGISLVTGFFSGVGILIFAFLSSSNFSLQSGASPMLFSMITFFCLTIANYLYVWGLATIFPMIYTRERTVFVQISVFSVILYIIMAVMYPIITSLYPGTQSLLGVFTFHVLFNVFGLLLLTGILSQYRYSLLIFYADFFSLILSVCITTWVYLHFTESGSTLFILMALCAVCFFIGTFSTFGIIALYSRIYQITGSDPIGNILSQIEFAEKKLEKDAEKILLTKR